MRYGRGALLAGATMLGLGIQGAWAADAFYAGKTITLMVGQTAGGASDLDCRMDAEYMGKYIAGNPTIIVKNEPSVSGITVENQIGGDSRKDGLTLICGQLGINDQLVHNPALHVDFTKLNYIMGDGQGQGEVAYIRSDTPPGIKSPADFFGVTGLILSGFTVNSTKDISERLGLQILGIDKYKYVTGLTGTADARAKIQQKFTNFYSEGMTSYAQVTQATMEKTGEVVALYDSGLLDDAGHLTRGPTVRPDLPSLYQFYKTKFGKAPSGPAWELYDLIMGNAYVAAYTMALPADAPPAAVEALRAAVEPLNRDPEFIAASDKLRGKGITEQPGTVVLKEINGFLNMSPELLTLYNGMIASGENLKNQK